MVALPGEAGPVTQIVAGLFHSLVATASGQIYAFGFNYYRQLGNATNNGATTPNPTPTLADPPRPVGTIADIERRPSHLVLTTKGSSTPSAGTNTVKLGDATGIT